MAHRQKFQYQKVVREDADVPAPEQRIYANTMTVRAGAYDLALDFGNRVGEEPADGLVRVSMSYEHLGSMVRVLQKLMDQYSEEFGAVPDPETVIAAAAEGESEES